MKTVLVTGAKGFIGKNLVTVLRTRDDLRLIEIDVESPAGDLSRGIDEADVIFHLAGVNRPDNDSEFESINAGMTESILQRLRYRSRKPLIVLSSSIQAEFDNPYGRSKRKAEELIEEFSKESGAGAYIFRLKNVFGKWSRPNYNSVVATFCYNVSHDLPININDPERKLELVYIDDVVRSFIDCAFNRGSIKAVAYADVDLSYEITVQGLADRIKILRGIGDTLMMPDMADELTRKLYATYLSYSDGHTVQHSPEIKTDARGSLAELFKSESFGQIFVSRTKACIIRGNHYHHTKVEKFCVLQGDAVIRFRHVSDDSKFEVRVRGEDFKIVDIPPGYTHSIENLSKGEMIVLFWANEIFDPQSADTYFAEV